MGNKFEIPLGKERGLISELRKREDNESKRLIRFLDLPDLSRTSGSPLEAMVEAVKSIPALKDFDDIKIPEVVPTNVTFDMFGFSKDHPARSKSDTYYVDEEHILRTHDTVMWYYYLNLPEIKERIKKEEPLGVICYGKVYRKDEIDRTHMNVFHQMGGLYLIPDKKGKLEFEDLKNVLTEITTTIFGKDINYRFSEETFPYTDPSIEVEILKESAQAGGEAKWVEILGSGMPKKEILKNFGLEGYNGWAFGFGLERLAMISMDLPDIRLLWSDDERVKKQLKLGQKFEEVSKYPPVVRDISFVVSKNSFVLNDYFDMIRETGGDVIEEVELLDKYEDEKKFGEDKLSYTFRITYRHLEKTLTNGEVNELHKKIEEKTVSEFSGVLRLD